MSVDSSVEAVDRMVAAQGITWPQLWAEGDYEAEVPKRFAVEGTPLLYLLDRAGRVAGRFSSLAAAERHLPEVLATPASIPRVARDLWQRPNALMDRLGVAPGSVVADIGAGEGYFTRHLAHRVGAQGKVYAVDIAEKVLATLKESLQADGLKQVEPLLGAADDPRLATSSLDAALVVDTYHEFTAPQAMVKRIQAALRPGGRLAIVERTDALGRARAEYGERHRMAAEVVVQEVSAQGLRLLSFEREFALDTGGETHFVLVFDKPVRD